MSSRNKENENTMEEVVFCSMNKICTQILLGVKTDGRGVQPHLTPNEELTMLSCGHIQVEKDKQGKTRVII